MTIYIAGRISGDRDYKKKFANYQKKLEAKGHVVLNPALLPAKGFSYEAYLRMSTAMLKECEVVCFLPDWQKSKGALLEYDLAKELNKLIWFIP